MDKTVQGWTKYVKQLIN